MMTFDSVVLPHPLSPTRPKHSPRRIEKLTSSTARNAGPSRRTRKPVEPLAEGLDDVTYVEMNFARIRRPRLLRLDERACLVVDRAHGNQPFAGLHVEVRHRTQQRAAGTGCSGRSNSCCTVPCSITRPA